MVVTYNAEDNVKDSNNSFIIDTKPTYIPASLRFDAKTTAKITGIPLRREDIEEKEKKSQQIELNNEHISSKNTRRRQRKVATKDPQVGPSSSTSVMPESPSLLPPPPKSIPEVESSDFSLQQDSRLPSASEYEDSPTGADLKSRERQRYFGESEDTNGFDQSKKCTRCKEPGHNLRSCPHVHCPICGALDSHEKRSCPFYSVCWRCGGHGHRTHDCKESRASMRCPKCSVSHFRNMCPTYWQGYAISNPAKPLKRKPKIRMTCYNCASPDHFGDDCPTRKGTSLTGPTGFRRDMVMNRDREFVPGDDYDSIPYSDREEGEGEIALAGGPPMQSSSRHKSKVPHIVNGKKMPNLPQRPPGSLQPFNSRKRTSSSRFTDYDDRDGGGSGYHHLRYDDYSDEDLSFSIDKRRKLNSTSNYRNPEKSQQTSPRNSNNKRSNKLPRNPISIPLISRINGETQTPSPNWKAQSRGTNNYNGNSSSKNNSSNNNSPRRSKNNNNNTSNPRSNGEGGGSNSKASNNSNDGARRRTGRNGNNQPPTRSRYTGGYNV